MLLVAHLDAGSRWHRAAGSLVERSIEPARSIRLCTATLTMDEVVFVLLEELVARPPYSVSRSRSRSQYLGQHPEVVRELMRVVDPLVEGLTELLTIEPVLPEDVVAMRREMAAAGLLPRDAIHIAVMRRLGVTAIASDDDAFERCANIRLYKPLAA
jgi:predicted nucleic acid-binding protein